MDVLKLCALVVACLTLAGPAGAQARGGAPPKPAACSPETAAGPEEVCGSLLIGLSASPNPTPAGGTVSFSWSVSPETDCWDNLGHSAWGGYSFAIAVSEPFTWVVSCSGGGIESATLDVRIQGPEPPPPPPPPPPGDHDPRGYLDGVDPGSVAAYGWTCDPDAYGAALEVRFYADGAPGIGSFLGTATAGQTREPAVGDLCGGTRDHGFTFALPASVQDGRTHSLHAYAVSVGDGNNVELIGSPKAFTIGGGGGAAPTVNLGADPELILVGSQASLNWSSTNASACTGSWSAATLAPSGSATVYPQLDTAYGINCSGAGGTVSASKTVTVIDPATYFGEGDSSSGAAAAAGGEPSVSTDGTSGTGAPASGCKWVNGWVTYKSVESLVLWWRYRLQAYFCFDRRKVSSVCCMTAWSDYVEWPWFFDHNISEPAASGVGTKQVRVFAQGKFTACVLKTFGCVDSKAPYISITMFADGTHSFSWGIG